MANPHFYFYPRGDDGFLRSIDLGEMVSNFEIDHVRVVSEQQAGDLTPSTVDEGGALAVTIELERFTGSNLANQLRSFETHALKGLPFSFALDADNTWAGFSSIYTPSGSKGTLKTGGNVFSQYEGVLNLANGDTIVIHDMNPSFNYEEVGVSSYSLSTGEFTLSRNTYYDQITGPTVIRERDFFPVLFLDPSQRGRPIVTDDRRNNYTLSMRCLYSPNAMAALYVEGGGVTIGSETVVGGSLQGFIDDFSEQSGSTEIGFAGLAPRGG